MPAAAQLVDLARTKGRKPILYSLVSVVAVVVTQAVLILCHGVLGWGAAASNIAAVAAGTVPSYTLNRSWVWGKRGKSHLWREVVPFWALSFLGLALSTVVVAWAATWKDTTFVVSMANLASFGVLWVGKFLILHYLLFGEHTHSVAQTG